MLGIVHALLGRTAAQALGWLMASVDAFVGSARQHDDITCLVLRTFTPPNLAYKESLFFPQSRRWIDARGAVRRKISS